MSWAKLLSDLKQNSDGLVGPMLNRWLMERNGVAEGIEPWVHPSSLPPMDSLCSRALFFDLFTPLELYPIEKLTSDHSGSTHRIFDNGTAFHRRWQAYFIEMGICDPRVRIGWEIPILDESLVLKGHADALIYPEAEGKNKVRIHRAGLANGEIPQTTEDGGFAYSIWNEGTGQWVDCRDPFAPFLWKPYGKPVLAELKSINDRGWSMLTEPHANHKMQATAYSGFLRRLYPELDRTLFIYENKNNQLFKEFVIAFDQTLWNRLQKILSDVASARAKGKLPTRVCTSGLTGLAVDCEWTWLCFAVKSYKELLEKGNQKRALTQKTAPKGKARPTP